MNYQRITYTDINNGTGCRVTLWVSGCTHHCKGCHNKCTWDFNGGKPFDAEAKEKLFSVLSLPYIKGLTLSGGDPMDSYLEVADLVHEVKCKFPKKDIWMYTGYTLHEAAKKDVLSMLDEIDYVVDGEYVEEKRDTSLAFRGSSNQIIWKRCVNDTFEKVEL